MQGCRQAGSPMHPNTSCVRWGHHLSKQAGTGQTLIGWLAYEGTVEIVAAVDMAQSGAKFIGLMAELLNRQWTTRTSQACGGRLVMACPKAMAQGREPSKTIPNARAPEITVVAAKELIPSIATEGHSEAGSAGFATHQVCWGCEESANGSEYSCGSFGISAQASAQVSIVSSCSVPIVLQRAGIGRFIEAGFSRRW